MSILVSGVHLEYSCLKSSSSVFLYRVFILSILVSGLCLDPHIKSGAYNFCDDSSRSSILRSTAALDFLLFMGCTPLYKEVISIRGILSAVVYCYTSNLTKDTVFCLCISFPIASIFIQHFPPQPPQSVHS